MRKKPFQLSDSVKDIKNILNSSNPSTKVHYLRKLNNSFTYTNEKNVKENTALFVDLRDSSDFLRSTDQRVVARFYRAYISQVENVLLSQKDLVEMNVVGDCVSAVFVPRGKLDTLYKDPTDVINALNAASKIKPLLDIINVLFSKHYHREIDIKAGIGIARGRALIFKAGLRNRGDSKYIFLGDNVNIASHLCDVANKRHHCMILINNIAKNNCMHFINGFDKFIKLNAFYKGRRNKKLGLFYESDFWNTKVYNKFKNLKQKYLKYYK